MDKIWSIYYQHWAKESNRIRRKRFYDTHLKKTILTIFYWATFTDQKCRPEDYTKIQKSLLEGELWFFFSLFPEDDKGRFLWLEDLVDQLCPSHTPKDWDLWQNSLFMLEYEETVFFENRLRERLAKGQKIAISKLWSLNTDQMRSLESILALF